MQHETPCCLLVNQVPIPSSALRVLFFLRWVIDRELDVMESSEFVVFQNSNTMTIGSNGELDRLGSQVGQYCLEVGMHPVLTGAEINRAYRQTFHDSLHLVERETVRASRITVTKGAREIALVGEPEPERNTGIRRDHQRCGRRRLVYNIIHARSFMTGATRCARHCV